MRREHKKERKRTKRNRYEDSRKYYYTGRGKRK